jgi:DNA invertase Pin-like site-specific DNA recombinase
VGNAVEASRGQRPRLVTRSSYTPQYTAASLRAYRVTVRRMGKLHIGYGRVSTSSGEQLGSLEGQLRWLVEQGCEPVLHDVESGLSVGRADYGQLLTLITSGRAGVVRATRADRLGRDAPELVRLVQLCDRAGVTVITRDDGRLSARTAEELLLLYVRAALAQGESMKISQRVNAALTEGRSIGKPMRRPCWGYQLRADRLALEPHPIEFGRAQRFIRLLRASRWRMAPTLQAHRDLAPFSSCRGVRAWLLNPTLRGGIGYRQRANHAYDQITWGRHPALLTHGEFAEFELVTAGNRLLWGSNAATIPRMLTGLCECSECGCRLKYIGGRAIPSLKCSGTLCSQLYRGTREDVIARYVIAQLSHRAAERLAAAVSAEEPPEAQELRRAIAALVALGDPDLAGVIAAKEQRLELLLKRPVVDDDLAQRISDPRWFDLATADELREILHATVERVTVTRQEPTAIRLRL